MAAARKLVIIAQSLLPEGWEEEWEAERRGMPPLASAGVPHPPAPPPGAASGVTVRAAQLDDSEKVELMQVEAPPFTPHSHPQTRSTPRFTCSSHLREAAGSCASIAAAARPHSHPAFTTPFFTPGSHRSSRAQVQRDKLLRLAYNLQLTTYNLQLTGTARQAPASRIHIHTHIHIHRCSATSSCISRRRRTPPGCRTARRCSA